MLKKDNSDSDICFSTALSDWQKAGDDLKVSMNKLFEAAK